MGHGMESFQYRPVSNLSRLDTIVEHSDAKHPTFGWGAQVAHSIVSMTLTVRLGDAHLKSLDKTLESLWHNEVRVYKGRASTRNE
jgi:hypothetical protein